MTDQFTPHPRKPIRDETYGGSGNKEYRKKKPEPDPLQRSTIGLLIISLMLCLSIPPASAATWGDTFSIDSRASYNLSNSSLTNPFAWENSMLRVCATSYSGLNRTMYQHQMFGDAVYNYDAWIARTGRNSVLIFNDQENVTPQDPYQNIGTYGNRYLIYTQNVSSIAGGGLVSFYSVIAGSSTLLKSYNGSFIPNSSWHKVTVKNSLNITSVWINDSKVFDIYDNTFVGGFAGRASTNSYTVGGSYIDNFYINETASSVFTCSPVTGFLPLTVTCTQSGDNYSDPGVNASWIWGDGTTSTGTTGTHTYYLPGLYSVSLLNSNVAGTSSAIQHDYINAGGPGYPHIEPSSPTITDKWDAFITKIFGVFT